MRLALVAGEASGDLLAALMLQGLKQQWPGLRTNPGERATPKASERPEGGGNGRANPCCELRSPRCELGTPARCLGLHPGPQTAHPRTKGGERQSGGGGNPDNQCLAPRQELSRNNRRLGCDPGHDGSAELCKDGADACNQRLQPRPEAAGLEGSKGLGNHR